MTSIVPVTLRIVAALVCGTIFGFGLALSGMMDPARVRGFLDVAGNFDPSLGFVLVGALFVSALGYRISRHIPRPVLDEAYHLPARRDIDRRLLAGAAVFGIGWGMAGLCPGPAIASLSLGLVATVLFTAMMVAGILLHEFWIGSSGAAGSGAAGSGAAGSGAAGSRARKAAERRSSTAVSAPHDADAQV